MRVGPPRCRSCASVECEGRCWGFWKKACCCYFTPSLSDARTYIRPCAARMPTRTSRYDAERILVRHVGHFLI